MKNLFKYIKLIKQKPAIASRGLKALFLANVLKRNVLRGAELAVTYRCQAKCEKCSCRSLIDITRQEMSLDQIVDISKRIVDAGGILIDLTGGEPLLRDDIVTIVEHLNRMPIILSLATNGLLLTDELLKNLKKVGLNVIQFGLVSPVSEEHDKEMGIEGSYLKVISRIKKARNLGIEVLLNTVVTRDILYSNRIGKLANMAKENNCFLSLILPARVGGWKDKDVNLGQKDYAVIKKWLKLKFVTTDTESCYKRGVCPAGREKVYISAYGDLYPCPFVHKKWGNLLENDFIQLWKEMHIESYKECVNVKYKN